MPILDRQNTQQVERYTAFMQSTPEGRVTQDLAWGQVKNNWESRAVFVENAAGEIVGAMTMLLTDTPAGKKFAYASKGPVIAGGFDLDILSELIEEAKTILDDAYLLRMDPEVNYSEELNDALLAAGYKTRNRNVADAGMHATIQPRLNMVINLRDFPDAKETLDLYLSKAKRKLKLPFRDGVEVSWGNDKEAMDAFYNTYETMAKRHEISYRPKEYFERMQEAFGSDMMRIFMAKREGELLSAAIAFKYGNKVWYMYGGSMDGNIHFAPYAAQSAMIQWALDENIALYDMGGIGEASDDDSLYRFKRNFVKADPLEYIGEIDVVLDDKVYAELVK